MIVTLERVPITANTLASLGHAGEDILHTAVDVLECNYLTITLEIPNIPDDVEDITARILTAALPRAKTKSDVGLY